MYYLGIESGVRTSIAYLSRYIDRVEFEVEVGPMNHYVYGLESTKEEIKKVIDIILSEANITLDDISGICFSGSIITSSERVLYKEIFRTLGYKNKLIVCNDSVTRLVACQKEKKGAILLAGTGSILYGFDRDKNLHRVGGWGAKLGDKGSAYNLVKDAIIAIVDAYDKREEETELLSAFKRKFHASSVEEIINYFYSPSISNVILASSAQLVCEVAENGDNVASEIVKKSYEEHIKSIKALCKKLDSDQFDLILNGSLFVNSPSYLKGLIDVLNKTFPNLTIQHRLIKGSMGALILASDKE